jgi:putative isomerase
MKRLFYLLLTGLLLTSCAATSSQSDPAIEDVTLHYPNLLNVIYTPAGRMPRGQGFFTDQGSWMGFTLPGKDTTLNGFCGPYDLDHRQWLSKALCVVSALAKPDQPFAFRQDTAIYYPGRIVLQSSDGPLVMTQELIFVSANHALVHCHSNQNVYYQIEGILNNQGVWNKESHGVTVSLATGEVVMVSFPENTVLETTAGSYSARSIDKEQSFDIVLSYFNTAEAAVGGRDEVVDILGSISAKLLENTARWSNYIATNLRNELPEEYHRILVKSVMTLLSNWRSPKGALLHAGVVPSHAMNYFVGFWAWDSWKHAVALSSIDNALAKDQVRTMFDYQDETGMIADCIYTNPAENNYRDSKPPLAAWAVEAIFQADHDTAFIAEMYPKLLKYYQWWFRYRDHDQNGICEYGATDGTLEAAKWESGMDNAVRFDHTQLLQNADHAWSMDQESIDLNAYLQFEYTILQRFASLLSLPFEELDKRAIIQDYFFDDTAGYFFDKTLSHRFVKVYGPEGWTPLWTGLASPDQVSQVVKIMQDTTKFSTYIPFPTVARDHPEFNPRGYWRGPIWLDQVYFAISALRKNNYHQEADAYTRQVFDRLEGLKGDAPIHENYDVNTGERLKASHFSWSAAHLFMLYQEFRK